jgi:phosphonate transport system ATP-binding protein
VDATISWAGAEVTVLLTTLPRLHPLTEGAADPMIHIRDLRKVFPPDKVALDGVDLDVSAGEFVMVIGQSGAGKTTLLRCLNRLVEPTAGEVRLNGSTVTGAPPETLRHVRRQIGVIFQQFNLVKRASVLENVLTGRLGYVASLPSLLARFPSADRDLAMGCLRLVGLEELAERRADTLSGGEQQRWPSPGAGPGTQSSWRTSLRLPDPGERASWASSSASTWNVG